MMDPSKRRQARAYDAHADEYAEGVAVIHDVNFGLSIRGWLPRVEGKRILDLGCGGGYVASEVCHVAGRVVGLDISLAMVERARAEVRAGNVVFGVGDAEMLPYGDGEFDVVLSYGTFHHLPHPERSFAECFRVLRRGGLLLGFERNKTDIGDEFDFWHEVLSPIPIRWLKPVKEALRRRIRGPRPAGVPEHPGHPGLRSPGELSFELRKAGFEAEVRALGFPMVPFFVSKGSHRLYEALMEVSRSFGRIRALRDQQMVVQIEARKP